MAAPVKVVVREGDLVVSDENPLPVVMSGQGDVDAAAVTDPAEDGTVIGLLKGILTALNSIDAKTPAV